MQSKKFKWFADSPDAGDPACICSLCGEVIGEEEVPLRLFRDDMEARFHFPCAEEAGVLVHARKVNIETWVGVIYGGRN